MFSPDIRYLRLHDDYQNTTRPVSVSLVIQDTGHPVLQTSRTHTHKHTQAHTIRFAGKRIKYYKTSHATLQRSLCQAVTLNT